MRQTSRRSRRRWALWTGQVSLVIFQWIIRHCFAHRPSAKFSTVIAWASSCYSDPFIFLRALSDQHDNDRDCRTMRVETMPNWSTSISNPAIDKIGSNYAYRTAQPRHPSDDTRLTVLFGNPMTRPTPSGSGSLPCSTRSAASFVVAPVGMGPARRCLRST